MPHVSSLTPLVHNEHMDGQAKRFVLDMRRLKDEIQARGLNLIITARISWTRCDQYR
jgi:hypothetical protein